MKLLKPRFKIEIYRGGGRNYYFYIWRKLGIVASGYDFSTATEAAEAAVAVKKDLLNAWEITH